MQSIQLVLPLFGATDTQSPQPPLKRKAPTRSPLQKPGPPSGSVYADGALRQTLVGSQPVTYLFRRRRRKSIGFTIDQRGLIVSAPRWVTLAEVDDAVREKGPWIARKTDEWRAFEHRLASLDTAWEDGGQLRYLGESITIRLGSVTKTAHLDDSGLPWQLQLPLPTDSEPQNVRAMIENWLRARAGEVLAERVEHFAHRLGSAPSSWMLSNARTQWGSCNADGVIRLNWRLINLPMELLDYVVAHELAHLHELNHSPAFWAVVEQLLPGYQRAKDELNSMPEHLAL